MPANDKDPPIRILHLSDIHFRVGKAWDADPVLRALARFVKTEAETGLVPDLVVISGDLAFSGKADEYAMARAWLDDQLWPALPDDLPRDRLLLVPGNHDVERTKVRTGVRSMQDGLLTKRSQDDIAALLGDDDERGVMLRRHSAYMDFVAEWYGDPQPLPWWQRVIAIRGTSVHVAGLNTAWMSCGDEDRSRLLLGRYQLTQTVMAEAAEGADWRIAVLHHPWEYLAEFDHQPSRSAVHQHGDLLLRGHLHQTRPERVVPPDRSRQCLELAAGCVYETSEYPNAFQWIELAPAEKRVRVLFRAWLHDAWAVDRNQPGCPDGDTEFDLGAQPAGRPSHARSGPPPIPPDYLAWVRRTCAGADLLGQSIQDGQNITLSQVYVPALTQPAGANHAAADVDGVSRGQTPGRLAPRGEEERKPTTLLQRLDAESLYVPAPPGAGKSTFCRWAALRSAADGSTEHAVPAPDEYREPVPTALQTRLPLRVPLREFWRSIRCEPGSQLWGRDDLEAALARWVDQRLQPDGLSGRLLLEHLTAGSAFLMLDGVDEVPGSESRDGGTVYPRALLVSGLTAALPAWEKRGIRTLVTSRPWGLGETEVARLGLPRAPIDPLPEPLQNLFVERWFHTLNKPDMASGLMSAVRGRGDVFPLADNPMLLTALCVIYNNGKRLPDDRYELYESMIDNVLFNRYPGDASERDPVKMRLEVVALGMHTDGPVLGPAGGCLDAARRDPVPEISEAEIVLLLQQYANRGTTSERSAVEAAARCRELISDSGLLLPLPGRMAEFRHFSFQEFLAAERIYRTIDDAGTLRGVFHQHAAVAKWRPTLMFLFAQYDKRKTDVWGEELIGSIVGSLSREAVRTNPPPAVLAAEALELWIARHQRTPGDLAEGFRRLALDAIDDEIEVRARQALGLGLGRLGDPRVFDLRDPRAYVEVPAGTYLYGEEGETVEIATAFHLGRYPVTNGQYRSFMDDGGYHDRQWWSEVGWAWRQKAGATEPGLCHDRRWNGPNQPVVGVSFFEAEACAAWAGGRLPTEQEWEAAARGPEGFEYPWGNDRQDGICNTAEAGLGGTSAVGLFPGSRQAQLGLEDLAGNVWEWCSSWYDAAGDDEPRVVRGGSWRYLQGYARCAYRYRFDPYDRGVYVGFRVLCLSPIAKR